MRTRPNAAVQRMMVRNSISRCATSKISAKKNIMDNRKATDEVLRYCITIAAFDVLEFDKDALDHLTAAMKNRADVYTTERAVLGQTARGSYLESARNRCWTGRLFSRRESTHESSMKKTRWQNAGMLATWRSAISWRA